MTGDEHRTPGALLGGIAAAVTLLTAAVLVGIAALSRDPGTAGLDEGGKAGAAPKILSLDQLTLSGSPLPRGGRVKAGFLVRGRVDPPGSFLEVQAGRGTDPWEQGESRAQASDRDGTVEVFEYLSAGDYRWRARARSVSGESSEWQTFGGEGAQKAVAIGEEVAAPSVFLDQRTFAGRALARGEKTTKGIRILLSGATQGIARLEAEIKPVGKPYDERSIDSRLVGPDGKAEMKVPLPNGSYRWRHRMKWADGSVSPWAEFAKGAEGADFEIEEGAAPEADVPHDRDAAFSDVSEGTPAQGSSGGGLHRAPLPSEVAAPPPALGALLSDGGWIVGGAAAALLLGSILFWMSRRPKTTP